jgi:hypothetical protein
MSTRFFDRQDMGNPINGAGINDALELRRALGDVRARPPFFAELLGDNGFKLLLGVGMPEGCVQFSAADGSPPYFMAIAPSADDRDGTVEFLLGDTPSPVPRRYCLAYEDALDIAATFVPTGQRKSDVRWEEI